MLKVGITTADNPYNLFTQFEDWYRYDNEKGYGTCDFLARFTMLSDALSDEENVEEVNRVVDDILLHDPRKIYVKVTFDDSQETKQIESKSEDV